MVWKTSVGRPPITSPKMVRTPKDSQETTLMQTHEVVKWQSSGQTCISLGGRGVDHEAQKLGVYIPKSRGQGKNWRSHTQLDSLNISKLYMQSKVTAEIVQMSLYASLIFMASQFLEWLNSNSLCSLPLAPKALLNSKPHESWTLNLIFFQIL